MRTGARLGKETARGSRPPTLRKADHPRHRQARPSRAPAGHSHGRQTAPVARQHLPAGTPRPLASPPVSAPLPLWTSPNNRFGGSLVSEALAEALAGRPPGPEGTSQAARNTTRFWLSLPWAGPVQRLRSSAPTAPLRLLPALRPRPPAPQPALGGRGRNKQKGVRNFLRAADLISFGFKEPLLDRQGHTGRTGGAAGGRGALCGPCCPLTRRSGPAGARPLPPSGTTSTPHPVTRLYSPPPGSPPSASATPFVHPHQTTLPVT